MSTQIYCCNERDVLTTVTYFKKNFDLFSTIILQVQNATCVKKNGMSSMFKLFLMTEIAILTLETYSIYRLCDKRAQRMHIMASVICGGKMAMFQPWLLD